MYICQEFIIKLRFQSDIYFQYSHLEFIRNFYNLIYKFTFRMFLILPKFIHVFFLLLYIYILLFSIVIYICQEFLIKLRFQSDVYSQFAS